MSHDARPLLLIVDRNPRNIALLSQFLEQAGYRVLAARSLEEFDRVLAEGSDAAMALVDLAGFDRSIWDRCEQLRLERIPFLVLSPRQSAAIQQESLTHGARGVLVKPLVVRELLGLIRSLLGDDA